MALACAISNSVFASSGNEFSDLSTASKITQNCTRLIFENAVRIGQDGLMNNPSKALKILNESGSVLKHANLRVALKNLPKTEAATQRAKRFQESDPENVLYDKEMLEALQSKDLCDKKPTMLLQKIADLTLLKPFVDKNKQFLQDKPDLIKDITDNFLNGNLVFQSSEQEKCLASLQDPQKAGENLLKIQKTKSFMMGRHKNAGTSFFQGMMEKINELPLGQRQKFYTKLSHLEFRVSPNFIWPISQLLLNNKLLFTYSTGVQFFQHCFKSLRKFPQYTSEQFYKNIVALIKHPEAKRFLLLKDWQKLRKRIIRVKETVMHHVAVGPKVYQSQEQALDFIAEANPKIKPRPQNQAVIKKWIKNSRHERHMNYSKGFR